MHVIFLFSTVLNKNNCFKYI